MNINDLKAANTLTKRYGVKCVVYGPPGTGKTPIIQTAPRPVLLAIEPGLLSLRNSVNLPTFEAPTAEKVEEFFKWFFNSKEADQFDTLGVDSISQLAEVFLEKGLKNKKDGRAAYGDMSRDVMTIANNLFHLPNKNIYLIAKQAINDEQGSLVKVPYFPGRDLDTKIPHLFDEVLHLDRVQIPGIQGQQLAFRCHDEYGFKIRDRSGNLDKFEPPDLGQLFKKCML